MDDYVPKPIKTDDLARALQACSPLGSTPTPAATAVAADAARPRRRSRARTRRWWRSATRRSRCSARCAARPTRPTGRRRCREVGELSELCAAHGVGELARLLGELAGLSAENFAREAIIKAARLQRAHAALVEPVRGTPRTRVQPVNEEARPRRVDEPSVMHTPAVTDTPPVAPVTAVTAVTPVMNTPPVSPVRDTPPSMVAPAIDEAALRRFRDDIGAEVFGELIDEYLIEGPRLLAEIGAALAAAEAPRVVRAAHDLKSTSQTMGAFGLSAVAERLEHTAQTHPLTAAAPLTHGLAAEFARVREALLAARTG
jgi:HPt (histidine-containing phosphotransfer) domain-containing protein